jgi:hypothetical protein
MNPPLSHGRLFTNPSKREWVRCPICGEPDMRKECDEEGNALILCVNHACGSNGGDNFGARDTLYDALAKIADGASQPITEAHPNALLRCEIELIARTALGAAQRAKAKDQS